MLYCTTHHKFSDRLGDCPADGKQCHKEQRGEDSKSTALHYFLKSVGPENFDNVFMHEGSKIFDLLDEMDSDGFTGEKMSQILCQAWWRSGGKNVK